MTELRTQRLLLRPWRTEDFDLFHRINSDERVMRFFPKRRSQAESRQFLDWLIAEQAGGGPPVFQAVELLANGECIGFCGLHRADAGPFIGTGAIEIGWRFAPEHWGHGYATESARAWLAYGFGERGLEEVVSYAVPTNTPSIAVMKRIGMVADPASDFDNGHVPDTLPHLKPHVVYRIDRARWAAATAGTN